MKPPPFEYFAPDSVDEALALLQTHGEDAKILAGGQSLVPMLNFRLIRPSCLVDLNRIEGLAYVQAEADGGLAIGAMTRQRALEHSPLVQTQMPVLADAMRFVGHPQIRARGTIGGSLAHADPAAELPAVVTALGGRMLARGPGGERSIPARDFFQSYLTTGLAFDEILVGVRLSALPARTSWAFLEVSRRQGDFALVGVVALITLGPDEVCERATLVFTGVGPVPWAAAGAARVLTGQRLTPAILDRAVRAVAEEIRPDADIHASATYRRRVAAVLTQRAVLQAMDRAKRASP
jgi:aerobic carbon-monoxide dehydrogenase medium subunit